MPTILIAGAACVGLGRQPLWYDEIATVSAARRSIPHLFGLLSHTDAVLGPYYLFMHGWTAISTGAVWVRLPSVLAGVGAVALTAALGVRLRGPLAGLLAGAMLALNPFFAFYARDARPYTMVALACVASAHLLVDPHGASRRRRTAWVTTAVAAVYLHLFALLAVGAQALRLVTRRRWLAPLAVVAVLAAPMAWLALHERNEIGWVHPASASTYVTGFTSLAGGRWLALVAAVLAGSALALCRDRATVRWLLTWAALPAAGLVTVSLVKPVFVARYAIGSVPAIALCAGIGAVELWHVAATRWQVAARFAVAGSVVVSFGLGGTAVAAEQQRPFIYENLPAAVDLVLDHSQPGDGIGYLSGTVRMSASYYLPRIDPSAPRPRDVLFAPGESAALTGTFGGQMMPAEDAVESVAAHHRVWVLRWKHAHPSRLDRDVLALLKARYRPVDHGTFGQAEVTLWQEDAAKKIVAAKAVTARG